MDFAGPWGDGFLGGGLEIPLLVLGVSRGEEERKHGAPKREAPVIAYKRTEPGIKGYS